MTTIDPTEILIPLIGCLIFICIVFPIANRFRNFYVYESDTDQDQIRTYYRRNLRTGKRTKVDYKYYEERKRNNSVQENNHTEWRQDL